MRVYEILNEFVDTIIDTVRSEEVNEKYILNVLRGISNARLSSIEARERLEMNKKHLNGISITIKKDLKKEFREENTTGEWKPNRTDSL